MVHKGERVCKQDESWTPSGTTTGSTHHCQLAGCIGTRIAVKWDDGKVTFPCSRGMERVNHIWRIL